MLTIGEKLGIAIMGVSVALWVLVLIDGLAAALILGGGLLVGTISALVAQIRLALRFRKGDREIRRPLDLKRRD